MAGEVRRLRTLRLDLDDAALKRLWEVTKGAPLALHWTIGRILGLQEIGLKPNLPYVTEELTDAIPGDSHDLMPIYNFMFKDAWAKIGRGGRDVLVWVLKTSNTSVSSAELFEYFGTEARAGIQNALRWHLLERVRDVQPESFTLHPLSRALIRAVESTEELRATWLPDYEKYAKDALGLLIRRLDRQQREA